MKVFDLKQKHLGIFAAHRSVCVKNICISDLKSEVFCPCPFPACVHAGREVRTEKQSGLWCDSFPKGCQVRRPQRSGAGLSSLRREKQDP